MCTASKKSVRESLRAGLNEPTAYTVRSHLFLGWFVGLIGIALPFVLIIGKVVLEGPGIQPSISDYYYTIMRDVFVGSLCAIGVFLLSYQGHYKYGSIAGDIAFVFAIGTAVLPTTPVDDPTLIITKTQVIIGYVHLGCATALFLTLAFFCLLVFPRRDQDKESKDVTPIERNTYIICGFGILACILVIPISSFLLTADLVRQHAIVFWCETLGIWFFGLSWFIKGKGLHNLLFQARNPQLAPPPQATEESVIGG